MKYTVIDSSTSSKKIKTIMVFSLEISMTLIAYHFLILFIKLVHMKLLANFTLHIFIVWSSTTRLNLSMSSCLLPIILKWSYWNQSQPIFLSSLNIGEPIKFLGLLVSFWFSWKTWFQLLLPSMRPIWYIMISVLPIFITPNKNNASFWVHFQMWPLQLLLSIKQVVKRTVFTKI